MSFFWANMSNCVIFKHDTEDFQLEKEAISLRKYHRDFGEEKVVNFVTNSNHSHVKMFFEFLQNGDVPDNFEDQMEVFQLLKEWECHFTVFDSFRTRIQSKEMNGIIFFGGHSFPINVGCFFFQSLVFQESFISNPHEIICIKEQFMIESIQSFIDLIHHRIQFPKLEHIDCVLEICHLMGCNPLIALINKSSPECILSAIIRKQDEDSFDFTLFKKIICDNLEIYLNLEDFCRLSLSLLMQVFQASICTLPLEILRGFFERSYRVHGAKIWILLSVIHFQPAKNVGDLSDFFRLFSQTNNDDFFSINCNLFFDIPKQLEKSQQTIIELMNKINMLENDILKKEADNRIKKEEEEIQISILLKKIEEQDQKIALLNADLYQFNDSVKKKKEKFEKIGKWKSIKAPDFEDDIFQASAKGKLSSIIFLLENGKKVNEKFPNASYKGWGSMQNSTPLHFAAYHGHDDIVEYLIKKGAIIDSENLGVND